MFSLCHFKEQASKVNVIVSLCHFEEQSSSSSGDKFPGSRTVKLTRWCAIAAVQHVESACTKIGQRNAALFKNSAKTDEDSKVNVLVSLCHFEEQGSKVNVLVSLCRFKEQSSSFCGDKFPGNRTVKLTRWNLSLRK
jgi:hypothetical protein